MAEHEVNITGGCLCKGVRYHIEGKAHDIVGCHCTQCRKTTGHHFASSNVHKDSLRLTETLTLKWYRSSTEAERGFCENCGGQLFWRRIDSDHISISAGTMDNSGPLKLVKHIFVADKGDYYELDSDLPQFDDSGR